MFILLVVLIILIFNIMYFLVGLIMLILNLGSKFITVKFSASQEAYLRNSVGRQLLIFAIAWIGDTKRVLTVFSKRCC